MFLTENPIDRAEDFKPRGNREEICDRFPEKDLKLMQEALICVQ